jgi:hypothetical protein
MTGSMKISDWKWLERVEAEIDAHLSGEQDATETLEFIGDIITDYHGGKMTQDELYKIMQHGAQSAHLLGQIHGKLHQIIQGINTPNTMTDVRGDLIQLFDYMTQEVGNLLYKPELKNEETEV